MKLTLGFSPCPNDTFIFDGWVNSKIETDGLQVETFLEDVQTLNSWAVEGKLDITKLSFPALFDNLDKYVILSSGSALGQGVGPLLIAKTMVNIPDVEHLKIAIPGENTTANFLLRFALPSAKNKVPMLFSDIEEAVVSGRVDAGLIIHENRFTYQQKGLVKILDLGDYWEQKAGLPIPLGCIAVKRDIDDEIKRKVDEAIRSSLQYSFSHYPQLADYVKSHAQAMDEEVMRKHIELYVNNYTMELGEPGREAIEALYKVYKQDKTGAVANMDTASSLFFSSI